MNDACSQCRDEPNQQNRPARDEPTKSECIKPRERLSEESESPDRQPKWLPERPHAPVAHRRAEPRRPLPKRPSAGSAASAAARAKRHDRCCSSPACCESPDACGQAVTADAVSGPKLAMDALSVSSQTPERECNLSEPRWLRAPGRPLGLRWQPAGFSRASPATRQSRMPPQARGVPSSSTPGRASVAPPA